MFEFRTQPLKALYTTYFILSTLFIRLPFWLITSIPAGLRPRKTWGFGRAVILKGVRAYVATWYLTSLPPSPGSDPESIASTSDAGASLGFTWVPALPAELITNEVKELMETQGVEALRTCGYWYLKQGQKGKGKGEEEEGENSNLKEEAAAAAGKGEKVLLHFHGGGYVTGSAHPQGGAIGPVTSGLLQHTSPRIRRIFAGGYRLSSSAPFPPSNPFPAALLDALASYHFLLHTLHFRAEDIIVSGDSAGGHLALALARYTANANAATALDNAALADALPIPGALLLLSPTSEWALTHIGDSSSMKRNAKTDYCGGFFKGYTLRSLLGKLPEQYAYTSPYISPASLQLLPSEDILPHSLFSNFPKRIYLLVGEAEICLDSYRTLRERLVKAVGEVDKAKAEGGEGGEGVVYDEVPDSTHDFLAMTWHEPERTEACRSVGRWIDTLP